MRQGNVIFLEEVLDEAVIRAREKMREQMAQGKTELTDEELETVGEMLGVGTVIYADLYQGPERNIKFDWDTLLAPEGNTARYIQYTHARCRSILRKANLALYPPFRQAQEGVDNSPRLLAGEGKDETLVSSGVRVFGDTAGVGALLTELETQTLLKQLHRMPHAVREAGEKFLPATVADWTYNLARQFSDFYEKCPVLKAPTPEVREARLALVAATAQGIKNGLALLGIGAPERM
jgi:arginyl-tRNA synthetase